MLFWRSALRMEILQEEAREAGGVCIRGRHTVARPAGDLSSDSDNRDRDTASSICPIIGDAPDTYAHTCNTTVNKAAITLYGQWWQ